MTFQGKFDVVGMGCCAVDTLGIYEGPIEEDQKMQVTGITRQGGGLVATGLVAVARLGGTARYIGKVGDDDHAQFVIREFKREGVDTNCVRIMPRMSCIRAIGLINPAKGSRTLFYCTDDAPLLEPGEMDRDEVLAGRVIFVDGFQLKAAVQAARWGREARRPILMDAELTDAGNDELADLATHVIASLGSPGAASATANRPRRRGGSSKDSPPMTRTKSWPSPPARRAATSSRATRNSTSPPSRYPSWTPPVAATCSTARSPLAWRREWTCGKPPSSPRPSPRSSAASSAAGPEFRHSPRPKNSSPRTVPKRAQ